MKTHEELARLAIALVMPTIQGLITQGLTGGREHLHIRVWRQREGQWLDVAVHAIGNPSDWKHPFDKITLGKASQAARIGQPNLVAQMMDPASLQSGDTVYYGSTVRGSVLVAASGFQPWFDVLVSELVAATYQQLIQNEIQVWKLANPDADFLPDDFLSHP